MKHRRLGLGAAAALAFAAGTATASPLRLDYCVDAQGGGMYQYTFTLTCDNHDGSFVVGQGWDWFIFGDGNAQSSPLRNFVIDPASLPVGPWDSLTSSGGGHNGPTFNPVTDHYWFPAAVGDSLTWRGTSTAFLDEPAMLFSTLIPTGGAVPANFEVAHRIACAGETQGACCRPDGSCIVVSSTSCTNEGGIYRGDNSPCGASANCPQPPTGACCLDSGCVITTSALCGTGGGTYHGNNSTCAAANCPAPTAYLEVGDVGDVPSTAGVANNGTGTLQLIHGSLANFQDADMYKIRICDPANFDAHLTFPPPAFTIGEIFLFDSNGVGVANRYGFNGPAEITNQFVASLPAGDYYVAVCSFLKRPLDAGGLYLWDQVNPTHFDNIERRPDGDGAANPIDHWDLGGGADGVYSIALTGACFVGGTASTCYANCDNSTTVPFLNVNDFVCFQTAFAAGASYANCDHSTAPPVLNIGDFVCFQSAFAAGCSAP
jgi:hypothetical protein